MTQGRWGLGLVLAVLLVAAAAVAGCDGADECETDSQCTGICNAGRCVSAECGLAGGGAECAAGQICMEGRCGPAPDGGE